MGNHWNKVLQLTSSRKVGGRQKNTVRNVSTPWSASLARNAASLQNRTGYKLQPIPRPERLRVCPHWHSIRSPLAAQAPRLLRREGISPALAARPAIPIAAPRPEALRGTVPCHGRAVSAQRSSLATLPHISPPTNE